MPKIENHITSGNVMNLVAQVAGFVGIVVTVTLAYGDLRAKDQLHDRDLTELRGRLVRADIDHDLLIEVRADLKQIRLLLEQRQRASLSSGNDYAGNQ